MAKLMWATPKGDELVAYMARVSNPKATPGDPSERLIKYLIDHKHWSPFEMVNVCVEIETSRDISRQILRHRSFTFQEFSGRYARYDSLLPPREARLQDTNNRQNSLETEDVPLSLWWKGVQESITSLAGQVYEAALERGVAKEVARAILPEGLVPTKMYMNGTLRSWIHYFNIRTDPSTQKEHRELAESLYKLVMSQFPQVRAALENGTT